MGFSGFSGASFPTFFRFFYFYGVTFKDLGDKTKILAKRLLTMGLFLVFGFWYQGLSFGFSGLFISASLGGVYTFVSLI